MRRKRVWNSSYFLQYIFIVLIAKSIIKVSNNGISYSCLEKRIYWRHLKIHSNSFVSTRFGCVWDKEIISNTYLMLNLSKPHSVVRLHQVIDVFTFSSISIGDVVFMKILVTQFLHQITQCRQLDTHVQKTSYKLNGSHDGQSHTEILYHKKQSREAHMPRILIKQINVPFARVLLFKQTLVKLRHRLPAR